MGQRTLINPDSISSNDAVILQGRGGESHITEGSGVNLMRVGESNQYVTIGQQFAGGTVLDVDNERGAQVQLPNGEIQWVNTNNISNPQVLPYLTGKDLNLIGAVKGGLTDVNDYGGLPVTQKDIDEAKQILKYEREDGGFNVTNAIKDGVNVDTLKKYFSISDKQINDIKAGTATSPATTSSTNTSESNATPSTPSSPTDKNIEIAKANTNEKGRLDVYQALKDGIDKSYLKKIGVDNTTLQKAEARIEAEPYMLENGRINTREAVKEMSRDSLLALGLSNDQINTANVLNKYEDAEGYFDTRQALKDGVTEGQLKIAGIKPANIELAKTLNSFDKKGYFTPEGYIDVSKALKGGETRETLLGVGVDSGTIDNAEKYNKVEKFLDDDGSINLDKLQSATDDELNILGITRDSLTPTIVPVKPTATTSDDSTQNVPEDSVKIGDTVLTREAYDSIVNAMHDIPNIKDREKLVLTLQNDGLEAFNNAYDKYFRENNKQVGNVWLSNESYNEIVDRLHMIPDIKERERLVLLIADGKTEEYTKALNDYALGVRDKLYKTDSDGNVDFNYAEIAKLSDKELDKDLDFLGVKDKDAWRQSYDDNKLIDDYVETMNKYYKNPEGTLNDYIYEADSKTLGAINRVYGTSYDHGAFNDEYNKVFNVDYTDTRGIKGKVKDLQTDPDVIKNAKIYSVEDVKNMSPQERSKNTEGPDLGTLLFGDVRAPEKSELTDPKKGWDYVQEQFGTIGERLSKVATRVTEEQTNTGRKVGTEFQNKGLVLPNTYLQDIAKSGAELSEKGIKGLEDWEKWWTDHVSNGTSNKWVNQVASIAVELVPNNIADLGILGLTAVKGVNEVIGGKKNGGETLGNLVGTLGTYVITLPKKMHDDDTARQGWAEALSVALPIPTIKGVGKGIKGVGKGASGFQSAVGKIGEKGSNSTFKKAGEVVGSISDKAPNVGIMSKSFELPIATGAIKDSKYGNLVSKELGAKTGSSSIKTADGRTIKYDAYEDYKGNTTYVMDSTGLKDWDVNTNQAVWDLFKMGAENAKEVNNGNVSVTVNLGNLRLSGNAKNMFMMFEEGKDGKIIGISANETLNPLSKTNTGNVKVTDDGVKVETKDDKAKTENKPDGADIKEAEKNYEYEYNAVGNITAIIIDGTKYDFGTDGKATPKEKAKPIEPKTPPKRDTKGSGGSGEDIGKTGGTKTAVLEKTDTLDFTSFMEDLKKQIEEGEKKAKEEADFKKLLEDAQKALEEERSKEIAKVETDVSDKLVTKEDVTKSVDVVKEKEKKKAKEDDDVPLPIDEGKTMSTNPSPKINEGAEASPKTVDNPDTVSMPNATPKEKAKPAPEVKPEEKTVPDGPDKVTPKPTPKTTPTPVPDSLFDLDGGLEKVLTFESVTDTTKLPDYEYDAKPANLPEPYPQPMPQPVPEPTKTPTETVTEEPEEKEEEKKRIPRRIKTDDDDDKKDDDKDKGIALVAWRQGSLKIKGKMKPVWVVIRKKGNKLSKSYEMTKPSVAPTAKGRPWQTLYKAGKGKVAPFTTKVGFNKVTVDLTKVAKDRIKFEHDKSAVLGKSVMPSQSELNKGFMRK